MRQNLYVLISANIAKHLARDPQRSNRAIAEELDVSEFAVRRMRTVLELGGLLAATSTRIGSDGVEQPVARA